MMNWGRAEQKASRYLPDLDADELRDQLDDVRAYLKDLTASFGKVANRQWGRARGRAADSAYEAEEIMKDHLAASLVVALGVGVLVGYLIRRSSE
jgi:ElaB/YqjD/DUF883 family membrane-anchored ribosome-binding protein